MLIAGCPEALNGVVLRAISKARLGFTLRGG